MNGNLHGNNGQRNTLYCYVIHNTVAKYRSLNVARKYYAEHEKHQTPTKRPQKAFYGIWNN